MRSFIEDLLLKDYNYNIRNVLGGKYAKDNIGKYGP